MRNGYGLVFGAALVVLVLIGLLALLTRNGREGDREALVLYCAAGLKPAVLPLAQAFEREYGQAVQVMYGGSGTLLSNLQVARRGDLYIASDQSYLEIAAEKELIGEVVSLAWQRPVLVVARGNPKNIHTLDDLERTDLRLTLGNPEVASIGRQTERLLARAGIWEAVKARVEANGVFKPTVPEVANDVKLGASDAGVVWDATAAQYSELEVVPVALFEGARERICVAVLKSSEQPAAALRFARYLNSGVGNAVLSRQGYETDE